MLKHPYLLSFCILGAALGTMTYITRHPELWLERAHEAELRAACERMDKALEKSVIEFECEYQDKSHEEATFDQIMTFKDFLRIERNGDRKRVTMGKIIKKENEFYTTIFNDNKSQRISRDDKLVQNGYVVIGNMLAPVPFFSMEVNPYDFEILKEMVDVEGHPCVVVQLIEPYGNSVFYLDPSIGYMPRKKIMRSRDSSQNGRHLTCRFEDYRQIADDVFFPFSYSVTGSLYDGAFGGGGFNYHGFNGVLNYGLNGGGETKILKVDVNPEFKEDDFIIHPELDTSGYKDKDWYYEEIKKTYKSMTGIMTFNL